MIKYPKLLGVKAPPRTAHLLGIRLKDPEAVVSIDKRAGLLVMKDNTAVLGQRRALDLEAADREGVFSALRCDAAVFGHHGAGEKAVAGGGVEG